MRKRFALLFVIVSITCLSFCQLTGVAQEPAPPVKTGADEKDPPAASAKEKPSESKPVEKSASSTPQLPGPEKLLNGGNFWDHWKYVSEEEKEANRNLTWKVISGGKDQPSVLVCSGKPYGYIRTQKIYENFQFSLEWMYPNDPNANSGILLFTTEPDKVWPKAFQVQLHRPEAGYVFPTPGSGAKSANKLSPTMPLDLPLGKWHQCVLTCRSGNISVMINGVKLGEVTGCDPSKGAIALQSEGAEIHFRKLVVEVLAPEPAAQPEKPVAQQKPDQP
ncbi:MAG TPA: hypothetical protein DCM07_29850 [Planctomycetaceae bacterium]|uniref:3-keto-disaccharide hydrolase n=2 Tax=Gimesia TaxID=1649453 RepID=UPI000C4FF19B|nr:DUF1080 domain-containing protein [Gimesia sp.]MAX39121.1 hypothetical protein [Gimesia sp.]HAH48971.1 hypothetical protein [Planctomycetaceae bacterium]|tara:strand:+ start:13557 stop:14387 length:831 start_codon:yes stop_codon:yes gene_type:complete